MNDRAATLERTLALIDAAFAGAPRPHDGDLLHERCIDDNDIVALYAVTHWRDMPDSLVYLGFALRHLDSGAAAVDSTIWSLSPDFYDGRTFASSSPRSWPRSTRSIASMPSRRFATGDSGRRRTAAEDTPRRTQAARGGVACSMRDVRATYAEGNRSSRPWTWTSLPHAGHRSRVPLSSPEADPPKARRNAQRSQMA
jgi:hypothetical protein